MSLSENQFKLGGWAVDPVRCVLSNEDEEIRLEKRVMAILAALAQAPGFRLRREQLLETVWKDKVVSDETLSVAISHLRKALGCSAKDPTYVETIGGYGFRLLFSPEYVDKPEQAGLADKEVARGNMPGRLGVSRKLLLLFGFIVLASALLFSISRFTWQSQTANQEDLSDNKTFNLARFLMHQGDEQMQESRMLLESLNEKYPNHPRILSELGKSMFFHDMRLNNWTPGPNYDQVKALFNQAVKLDPQLGDAHLQLGLISLYYDYDLPLAKKHFLQSLTIQPTNLYALEHYAYVLMSMKQFDKAIEYLHAVLDIDPNRLSLIFIGYVHFIAKQDEETQRYLGGLRLLNVSNTNLISPALYMAEFLGDEQKAFNLYFKNFEQAGYSEAELADATSAYQAGGLRQLNHWLAEVKQEQSNIGQFAPPLSTARYYVSSGDLEKALDYLEDAIEQRSYGVLWINSDPKYLPLHNHPRFQQVVGRLGLAM